jgi:hypothetical protein
LGVVPRSAGDPNQRRCATRLRAAVDADHLDGGRARDVLAARVRGRGVRDAADGPERRADESAAAPRRGG